VFTEDHDEIFVRIIGNLVSDPQLPKNAKRKRCFCKLASNAPARRYDRRTGQKIPDKERNKTRTIFHLTVEDNKATDRFMQDFKSGDRVIIEGYCITKKRQKMSYSQKSKCWIPCIIDIDGDQQNIEHVMEDQFHVTVIYAAHIGSTRRSKPKQHQNTAVC